MPTREILHAQGLETALRTLADQITLDQQAGLNPLLLGIYTRGVPLAHRLAQLLHSPVGALDITFFRDDLHRLGMRTPDRSEIPCDLTNRCVVLVDDVIFRGRTIRAALEAITHFGRPQQVKLAVLIDRISAHPQERGHRELPIQPDYRGLVLPTTASDRVRVQVQEIDGLDRVLLERE